MKISDPIIESICRALRFIEENLQEDIAVADIADAACYSLFHFCRLFNKTTHFTPYEYLTRRRLSEAAKALVETHRKIIEIAFDYQFNSPETFGRAFKRMFTVLPNQWRTQGRIQSRLLTPEFREEYLQHIHKGEYVHAKLSHEGIRHFVGLGSSIASDAQIIPRLWSLFERELSLTTLWGQKGAFYGIYYYPPDWEEFGMFYMAAKEIPAPKSVSPSLIVRTLPPLEYARFIHAGSQAERSLTLQYIYHTWLPKSGRRIAFPLEIERYGNEIPKREGMDGESRIFIPLKS